MTAASFEGPRPERSAVDAALEAFSYRAGRVRQDLYYCDVSAPNASTRELRVGVRAAAYMYLAAALEAAVKNLISGLLQELNMKEVQIDQLRLSLLALVHAPSFDALKDASGMKMWTRRAVMLESCRRSTVELFNLNILPLDGRTIRAGHFESLWQLFGFRGPSLPSSRHKLALRDLADARNDLAHGEVEAQEVAGRKAITDLLRLIDAVEDCVVHLASAIAEYLDNELFLR